jgi:hypothetical protein
MRVPPGVEEDQVPGMRADDRAVLLDRGDVRRVRVVRENELAAAGVIRAEEHACQGISVDAAFEAHRRTALDVQHDAIALVLGRRNRLVARCGGHVEELFTIGPVEPGQPVAHLTGVYPAARDPLDLNRLPRQDRGARELVEISVGGYLSNVLLPVCGERFVQVERGPAES